MGIVLLLTMVPALFAQSSGAGYTGPIRSAPGWREKQDALQDLPGQNNALMLAFKEQFREYQQGKKLPNDPVAVHFQNDSTKSKLETDDTSKYIPWSQYKWADDQLYTLTGHPPLKVTDFQSTPAAIYLGVYAGVLIGLHVYQEETFWSSTQSFRIRDNFDESLGANYFGHAIAGYFISYVSEQAYIASGVSYKLAPIYGALTGLAYQCYVEVLDGYGSEFSLSPYEEYANVLGITYFVLAQYVPSIQNWSPKFNYYPPSWFAQEHKADSQTPIDDYSAWNFWISANINNITDGSWKAFWPSWLNLAIGYGARNLGDPGEARLVTVALDYDLVKLLPDGGNGWNWFRQTLNFVKLPSPTIEWRFSRAGWKSVQPARFYLAYPFPIDLGKLKL